MRVSRAMTVVWGVVLAAVAFGARLLEDNVVNNALAIAGLVSGILLGLFLLGILTRRVGQAAALAGVLAGIAAVLYAKFGTRLAFPWFALVGSSTVFAVGLAAGWPAPTRCSRISSSITCRPACSAWWSPRSSRRRWAPWPAR